LGLIVSAAVRRFKKSIMKIKTDGSKKGLLTGDFDRAEPNRLHRRPSNNSKGKQST
jgi:hypothetical protein